MVYYRRKKTLPDAPARSHLSQFLTDKQERTLISALQVYSASNLGLKTKELRRVVKDAFKLDVSKMWAINKILQFETVKLYRRIEIFQKKFSLLLITITGSRTSILTRHAFPFVKSWFNFGVSNERIDKNNFMTSRAEKSMSLLSFLSASGSIFLSLYVFSADFANKEEAATPFKIRIALPTRSGGWPRCFAFTETGFLNKDVLAAIILHFCDLVSKRFSSTKLVVVFSKENQLQISWFNQHMPPKLRLHQLVLFSVHGPTSDSYPLILN